MDPARLTRRSLLAAGAGAVAAHALRPVAALADPRASAPARISEAWVGDLNSSGRTVELPRAADLLGVEWRGPRSANVQLRFRSAAGRWSAWVSAGNHGHSPVTQAPSRATIGEPIWTGGVDSLQVRSPVALTDVRLRLVDVSRGVGARRELAARGPLAATAALALATPMLNAGPGQPAILARAGWAQGISPPRVAPEYGQLRMAFVHHTENPNGYLAGEVPAMLRAIYAFHRFVNGWNDIGYNFVVDLYGRIFEARAGGVDEPVIGAHAGGYNYASTGIAVLGSFMSVPISALARRALERLLAWKLALHGVPSRGKVVVRVDPAGAVYSRFPANTPVSLPRVAGHRDGDSTDCPGDVLYGELPAIRAAVGQLAPRPVKSTLALAAPPEAPAGQAPSSTPEAGTSTPILTGTLAFLDGTPVAGAQILLQARKVRRRGEEVSESTLAQALTDSLGQWSLPTALPNAPTGKLWLRALCEGASGYGAAVSAPLHTGLTPLTTPVAPPPTPSPPVPTPGAAAPATG